MAIYHASLKAVQRSAGRSTTAAAAYRAACLIVDTRTGECHDYGRKRGVLHAELRLPGGQAPDRAEWWNSVELHHKRGDAVVARELVIALPDELARDEQIHLARQMAAALAKQYSVAVDVCVHEPSKKGDDRNTHAHILMTGCLVDQVGELGKKCEPLDPVHCARRKLPTAAEWVRPHWERLANEALARAGKDARIDHRSHADRGLEEAPSSHCGPAVTDMLRNGHTSDVAQRQADEAARLTAELLARQVLDAQAAAAQLEAQATLAQADLADEAEAAASAQANAKAAAAAQRLAEEEKRTLLLSAIKKYQSINEELILAEAERVIVIEKYVAAENEYKRCYEAQVSAGKSLIKTALSIRKIKQWERVFEIYKRAKLTFDLIESKIENIKNRLADAWRRWVLIDPGVESIRSDAVHKMIDEMEISYRRERGLDLSFEKEINFEIDASDMGEDVKISDEFVDYSVDYLEEDDEDDGTEFPVPSG